MEPKLNLIFTKALLKDRQNLDWVGVGPEASIGKVIPGKAKVRIHNTVGNIEIIKKLTVCSCYLSKCIGV